MNENFINLINDDRTPDELKAKLVLLSIKIQKCTTISGMKELFLLMVEVLEDVEKVSEGLNE